MRSVVLVEGESDAAALTATARVLGVDLPSLTTLVVLDGATNIQHGISDLPTHPERVCVLVDRAEEAMVRVRLERVGVAEPQVAICVDDLEEELIRALGVDRALDVVDRQRDRAPFASLQRQLAWRGRPVEEQLRRFLGSGAGRKIRYAAALAAATPPELVALPLREVVEWAAHPSRNPAR